MSGRVLVTGAAGGAQGATGRRVAEALLAGGTRVRAFVRTRDERAAQLQDLGAELAVGDLREIADVDAAMAGVDRVFFTYPVLDGLLDATAVVAAAARAAGVTRLVEVSQLRPATDAASPRTRQHWVSEQTFDAARVGAVHLRATVFFENLGVLATVGSATGELAVPLGPETNVIPLVAAADVARVATVLLADPTRPAKPAYHLVGAVPTIAELAAEFSTSPGIALRYVNVDPQVWRERMLAAGWAPHTVEHLGRLWPVIAGSARSNSDLLRVTDAVEEVTGNPAETLRDFLRNRARATEAAPVG